MATVDYPSAKKRHSHNKPAPLPQSEPATPPQSKPESLQSSVAHPQPIEPNSAQPAPQSAFDDLLAPTRELNFAENDGESHGQVHAGDHDVEAAVLNKNPWARGIDWPVTIWIAFVHVFALGVFAYTTWQAVVAFVFLSWVTGSLGVCMGYHRLLTHGSFQTYKPIRWFFAWLGGMSGEGSAITWVGNHRKHHAHSDKEGDPHSPRDGAWWSHMLWFMPNHGAKWHDDVTAKYAPDLGKDRVMVFLHKTFLVWHWVFGVALFFASQAIWNTYTAWSMVFWAVFLRTVFVLHVTWFVNSATHLWGYRNYKTTDDSTNLWWVGLLAFGEGWHNNHHAYQRMARHGHKWWEIDITYWAIWLMEKTGLAWNVVRKIPKHQKPA